MPVTNIQLWNRFMKENPNYESRVSMSAQEVMTERGFSNLERQHPDILVEFINASAMWALNIIMPSRARSWWDRYDCREVFNEPMGDLVQRLYGETAVEVDPGFLNHKQGDAKSPWITHRPEGAQAMFQSNDNYQGLLTIKPASLKQAFSNPTGVSRYTAAQLQGLENSYSLHVDTVLNEVLHTMLSDPLLGPNQVIEVPETIWNNKDALIEFFGIVRQVIIAMSSDSQSGGWNMMNFQTIQDESRLRLIVKPNILAGMEWYTFPGAYNEKYYNLQAKICPKADFGGTYYEAAQDIGGVSAGTRLYFCVSDDELKTKIKAPTGKRGWGLAAEKGSSTPITYSGEADVKLVDPHEDDYAVLLDKGTIFSTIRNPYQVIPWGPNPRTLETNYWANAYNNGHHYDRRFTCVKFTKAKAAKKAK